MIMIAMRSVSQDKFNWAKLQELSGADKAGVS